MPLANQSTVPEATVLTTAFKVQGEIFGTEHLPHAQKLAG